MKKRTISLLLPALLLTILPGCNKDNPTPPNESELITTVTITLVDSATGLDTVRLSFRDLDGDGGLPPVISGATLASNTTYTGSIRLLDESQAPVDDITEEVEAESDAHQFFYQPTPGSLLAYFQYLDTDTNGQPVGVLFRMKSGSSGSGNLSVILRHLPDKYGSGVSSGDITNAGGETDVEVTLPLSIL